MRRALAFVLLLLVTLGLSATHIALPEPVPVLHEEVPLLVAAIEPEAPPQTIEELRARIADVLARERVPGVGLALVDRDGPVWIGGVGEREIGGAPVDGDTVFRVASITKSFIGLGIMRLADEGRLDLDRPLAAWLPEVAIDNAWHGVAPVTLAHALEHTAGFDDMRFNETFTDDETISPAEALTVNPRSRIVRWQPGTRFSYSNVGYTVAARAIEVSTGEPFDAWLRREILRPLGMRHADFERTPVLASRLATGYRAPGRPAEFLPITHRPAGALLTSPRELAGLVHYWLRRGDGFPSIVSPEGLARIERTGTLPHPARDVGYGLGNYGDVGHPARSRGHDGGLPGFSSNLRYFPELGIGYVVLLNGYSGPAMTAIRRLVFAYLTRDRALPALPKVPNDPPLPPGTDAFSFANPRHELFGFIDRTLLGFRIALVPGGARLESFLGDAAFELVATPDGGYRHPRESGTSTRIARTASGDPVLLLHGFYGEATPWWLAKARMWLLGTAVFVLLVLARLFAVGAIVAALVRRRRAPAQELLVWVFVAGLAFELTPIFLRLAGDRDVLGIVHPWTIAIFASTLVLAIGSGASMSAAARAWAEPDRPSLAYRLVPSLGAAAAFGLTLWLGLHGIIGLRTWAW